MLEKENKKHLSCAIVLVVFGIVILLAMLSPFAVYIHEYNYGYSRDVYKECAYDMLDFKSSRLFTGNYAFVMIFLAPMSYAMLFSGIGMFVLALLLLTAAKKEEADKFIKYGSIAGLVSLICACIYLIVGIICMFFKNDYTLSFIPLLLIAPCFICYTFFKNSKDNYIFSNEANNYIYRKLSNHVLLLIFTFGIWNYIWIYRITKYLNCVKDEEERNPANTLLLCIFIPFYSIYWTYKSAQRIDKLAKENNISSDLSTLCLILAIFIGIVPPILMQDKINEIIVSDSKSGQIENADEANRETAVSMSITDELKNLKELLDMGVITQEEFDAKKKELLGL